jgi:hypothetical protein
MLALLIVAVHDEQFSHKLTTRSTHNFREVLVSILGHHFRLETYRFLRNVTNLRNVRVSRLRRESQIETPSYR